MRARITRTHLHRMPRVQIARDAEAKLEEVYGGDLKRDGGSHNSDQSHWVVGHAKRYLRKLRSRCETVVKLKGERLPK